VSVTWNAEEGDEIREAEEAGNPHSWAAVAEEDEEDEGRGEDAECIEGGRRGLGCCL